MSYSKATQELFDDWATRGRAEGMERGHRVRAFRALEEMPITTGDRLLDLGCGNGWATRWLREQAGPTGRAVGIDVSEEMLARARAASDGIAGLSFQAEAFDALPWDEASFDHAFSMEALYYAPDLGAALESIARVLRVDGTLTVCIDFYEENPYSASWPELLGLSMQRLSQDGWCTALELAGFTVDASFRCLDPRPVDAGLPEEERRNEEIFRREIGSLAIRGRRRELS
ncbi:MAG: class I SAM-dependent methyltransferase [Myxococcota bacterium]|nr:class I SAM-dependent methyltransferase [Myxococcota bacterium]